MRIDVSIKATGSTQGEFAPVEICTASRSHETTLDLQYASLYRRFGRPNPLSLDFLFLASLVYVVDKLIPRSEGSDAWTRDLSLRVPLRDPRPFRKVRTQLQDALSFLTGDNWRLSFSSTDHSLVRPKRRQRRGRRTVRPQTVDPKAVCLFSGGADSLTGAIDWLETHGDEELLLIGHYDGDVAGPKSDQKSLVPDILAEYPSRVELLQPRIGQSPGGNDDTFRSRSFLFLAMGLLVSNELPGTVPLIMPENGTIALNTPLTPSRRGSCSTRTAHPYFLSSVQSIVRNLGMSTTITNTLADKTKGEVFDRCANKPLLQKIISQSCSCAKRGHNVNWLHRNASHCGMCMPCVYRRAALHKVGWDNELYGRDFCTGELDIENDAKIANDVRACLCFLRRGADKHEIAKALLANGSVPLDQLDESVALVDRAMDEIRTLIRDKGNRTVRRHAGV